jgi:hypothetical protein
MQEPAPPYVGEGEHALWHVSEDPAITQFDPHVSATATSPEPRVWAVDTRHLPLFWFPRECPRAAFWATPESTREDRELLAGAPRVHAIEEAWLERMHDAIVVAYRPPHATFAPDPEVGGYGLSREPVAPLEIVELGDLVMRHEGAGIELRVDPNLWLLWDRVGSSTREFSGIRLRDCLARAWVGPPRHRRRRRTARSACHGRAVDRARTHLGDSRLECIVRRLLGAVPVEHARLPAGQPVLVQELEVEEGADLRLAARKQERVPNLACLVPL